MRYLIIIVVLAISILVLLYARHKKQTANSDAEITGDAATLELPESPNINKGVKAFMNGNYAIAFQILEPSAQAGNLRAQQILAKMYYAGNGVPKDVEKYYYWLQKAADNGDKSAKLKIKKKAVSRSLTPNDRPLISLVVIAHKMPAQLKNTLYSLSVDYQKGIQLEDYEVIIIENRSEECLPKSVVDNLPVNFHYHLREEASQSPVAAINEGLQKAKGQWIGLMIDGAHLLTPGVLQYVKLAQKINKKSFVTVPVYHLGPKEQNESAKDGYNQEIEQSLLEQISWPDNGYRLFEIGTRCAANPRGYFVWIMESNCYFAPREAFAAIGHADMDFQYPGGGAINLHLTRQLGIKKDLKYVVLGGEGSFHQYHGGVTTSTNREHAVLSHTQQLHDKWAGNYDFLRRNPFVLGHFTEPTQNELLDSSRFLIRHLQICRKQNLPYWQDDY